MLDVPDEDGVRRLLRPEPRERPSLGGPLRLDHLPPGEGRRPEVTDLAQTLEVGQRTEGLLDVRVRLGSVDLVQVDVVRAQAPEAVLHLARDPDPGVAPLVPARPHVAVDLGRQDDLLAAALQRPPDELLGLAGRVHVRRVDEVDTAVDRRVDHPDAVVDVRVAPAPEHHRSQAVRADAQARPAQCSVLHSPPFAMRTFAITRPGDAPPAVEAGTLTCGCVVAAATDPTSAASAHARLRVLPRSKDAGPTTKGSEPARLERRWRDRPVQGLSACPQGWFCEIAAGGRQWSARRHPRRPGRHTAGTTNLQLRGVN